MVSEEVLIKTILTGDQEAFRELIEKYQSIVFAIIFNITNDYQETENLAQETFLQVYRSLPQYKFQGLKTWIGRIAANKEIDWRRYQKVREQQISYSVDGIDLNTSLVDSVEEQVIRKEELEKVARLCNQLPSKYSEVVKKYFLQSKSYEQIAAEEGISIRTVESRLYRAKILLFAKN